MSRKGNCLDNSPTENFFGRLKTEMFYEKEIMMFEKTNKSVGIDLGVRTLITTSDNEKYNNPIKLNKIEKKIKRYQRQVSRRMLDSNNRKKARVKKSTEENKE